ncbi:MAG TPA: alpha/beta hydrolase [Anaerolineales bacterium]
MKTFETSWTNSQGLKFHSMGWEPDGAPKAAVALVHGLGEHVGRFAHVGAAFSDAGYAFMGFDLRGHGRSDGPRGHTPSFEAYMQDIDLLLEHVRSRYPGLPIFLYGHSLGGILVLNYGLRRKPDLKAVIATSSGLHTALEKQTAKLILAKVLGSLAPTVLLPNGLDTSLLSHDPNVERLYVSDPLVHDRVSLGFGKVMPGAIRWALQHASEFPLPLLLVHGTGDQIAYPSSSQEFAAALGGKAKLVLWDNLYHETHNEPEKAEVLKTTIQWMDEQLGK